MCLNATGRSGVACCYNGVFFHTFVETKKEDSSSPEQEAKPKATEEGNPPDRL
jgi:hypothetical protein